MRGTCGSAACASIGGVCAAMAASTIGSGDGSSSTCASAAGGGAAGFTVFTRRGGGSAGAAGLTGSGAFFDGAGFLPFTAGASAKMLPPGSWTLRCFASRSTNCRATTSSIVLEALFTSMP